MGRWLLLLGCTAACLAGCYDGPSDATVEAAVRDRISTLGSRKELQVKVGRVALQRCRRAGAGQYTCPFEADVDMDAASRFGAAMTWTGEITMIQVPKGWTYDPDAGFRMVGKPRLNAERRPR